jgi:hypothetical protein
MGEWPTYCCPFVRFPHTEGVRSLTVHSFMGGEGLEPPLDRHLAAYASQSPLRKAW